ncbi:hypothetical protein B857_03961 [Solibacillus isronensis B3W22]|uniref:Uncharacterized protein n=1 Tax=Solibacillus isronensis B3W22 TaxID=1224748 RepID=K1KLI2_9BACL|nr:hypothetical protein B857_03961 [Solibacillus isronensis B3W22]
MLGLPVGQRVSAGVDVGGIDGDARVLGLVLLVEVVKTHGIEGGDSQGDGIIRRGGLGGAGPGGTTDGQECEGRGPGDGRGGSSVA